MRAPEHAGKGRSEHGKVRARARRERAGGRPVEEARRKKGGAKRGEGEAGVVDSSSFSPLIVPRCCAVHGWVHRVQGRGPFRGRTPPPEARREPWSGSTEWGWAARRGRHLDSCWIKLE